MRQVFALVIAVVIAGGATAQDAGWTLSPVQRHWLPPVATIGDLPATGNQLGDVREVLDGPAIHCWDGAAWTLCGGTGGGEPAPVDSVFGRIGAVVPVAGDYTCAQVTDCPTGPHTPAAPVDSVHGRTGVVTAVAGDYTCAQVTDCTPGAVAAELDPTLTDDASIILGDGAGVTVTQTFDLLGASDPTLAVSAGAFELDGTIGFVETGTTDTLWRIGGDVHGFVIQEAVSNPVDDSPPTVFDAVADGRSCRGSAWVCDQTFCSPACRCGVGQGDCDTDADCLDGLVCGTDNGAPAGCAPTVDMCVEAP